MKLTYENKKVFIGIDVHKKDYALVAIVEGEIIYRGRAPAEPEKLVEFLKNRFKDGEIHTAYEAGCCGYVLHRVLLKSGIKSIVVNAASIEVQANNKVKTDKRDAKKIAEHLSQGRLKGIRVPSEKEEQGRTLSRTREQLVSNRSRIMNQVRMKLLQFGLLPKDYSKVLTIKDVKEFISNSEIGVELVVSIKILLTTWAYSTRQIQHLERRLKEQALGDPNEVIYRTVPGIGPIGARVLSNELGDMQQFKNEKALSSFVGLTPTERSSGDKICKGHISRQGSYRVRQLLTQAAWIAIRRDPALMAVYERISVRAGGSRAIVAVARKLICRIRRLFKTGEIYSLGEGMQKAEGGGAPIALAA